LKQRAFQLIKYVNKVYGLNQQLGAIKDGRINPQIELLEILTIILAGLLSGILSFNHLEGLLKKGYFRKLMGSNEQRGSADTFGYALERLRCDALIRINDLIINQARRNKVMNGGTIDGFTVVAIDGTEVVRSTSKHRSCSKCRSSVYNKDEADEITYYHENIVGAAYVGRPPGLVLGLERILKGEGEVTAAIRLLRSLYQRHFRYADILVFDALYAKAPVIKEVLAQNKIAVIRVKQENYQIVRDADDLFKNRKPDLEDTLSLKSDYYPEDCSGKKYRYRVRIWDEENFTSWEGVEVPLRVLKVEETRLSMNGEISGEKNLTHIVTSAGKTTLPTISLWRIMHRRWDIENKVFHDLKTYWGYKHSFHHEENAFIAMRWLIVLAFNLFGLFYHRRISQSGRRSLSKKHLRHELLIGFYLIDLPILEPG
jgi:hypothetical protein